MKSWKKERNYRRVRQADGSVKNIIAVDGQDVEVTDEVYLAYSQMDRHERYLREQRAIPTISLELLMEDDVPIDHYIVEHYPSAESVYLHEWNETEKERLIERLPRALDVLDKKEGQLIHALYFERISAREYARRTGVYHRAVIYQRDRILGKLKLFLKNNQ